jgi:hypothetical protein
VLRVANFCRCGVVLVVVVGVVLVVVRHHFSPHHIVVVNAELSLLIGTGKSATFSIGALQCIDTKTRECQV